MNTNDRVGFNRLGLPNANNGRTPSGHAFVSGYPRLALLIHPMSQPNVGVSTHHSLSYQALPFWGLHYRSAALEPNVSLNYDAAMWPASLRTFETRAVPQFHRDSTFLSHTLTTFPTPINATSQETNAIPRTENTEDPCVGDANETKTTVADAKTRPTDVETKVLAQLNVALSHISDFEKSAYLKALSVAPDLVFTESDPNRFLRHYNHNAAAAANAIVRYWKRRAEIFGDDAFLPMTLTGAARGIRDWIASGTVALLPDDSDGSSVVCFDSSRRLDQSESVRMKASFWLGQVLSENEMNRTMGFVVVVVLLDPRFDPITTKSVFNVRDTFPVKHKIWHFCNCIPSWNERFLVRNFARTILMFRHVYQSIRYQSHSDFTRKEIADSLTRNHKLSIAGLPLVLGGTWTYEMWPQWLEERMRIEDSRISKTINHSTSRDVENSFLDEPNGNTPDSSSKGSTNLPFITFPDQLEQALALMSASEKVEYSDALSSADHALWAKECNRDQFLRVEEYNAWLAAKRIIRYWNLRNKTFGEQRYRPLNQTGEGALDRVDLVVLNSGFVSLLPCDSAGRSVIWIDASLLQRGTPCEIKCRDRCLFYMFSILGENILTQSKGAVLIFKLDTNNAKRVDPTIFMQLAHALPIRFHSAHILCGQATPSSVKGKFTFADEVHTYTGSNRDELRSHLEAHGIMKSGLPGYLGGPWDRSKFRSWQDIRTRMEWQVPMGLKGAALPEALNFPGIREYNILPKEEQAERARRLNVMYSRRKRDRKRVRVEVLQEQCDEMQQKRDELESEKERLETLYAEALKLIGGVD